MNKTIKIIDLLNKIANGEEVPEKIKKSWLYEWKYDDIREGYCYMQDNGDRFDGDWLIGNMLNEEIEIIEDNDKLEKIKWNEKESRAGLLRTDQEIEVLARRTETLKKKIAELVVHINKIEERLDVSKNN